MSPNSQRSTTDQTRTYDRASSVVFLKTHELFGGLSNMAGGFPIHVQGTRIYTSEALYQACRFPHLPEVQRLIIGQASPMTAKMKSKPYRQDSRPDWDRVRVKVMRWCLRVKLAQNWEKFSELLLRTGQRPIVEESRKDDFWGAKPVDERTLVGMNVLGRLLMELREAVKSKGPQGLQIVEAPDIPQFLLLGRPIQAIGRRDFALQESASASAPPAPDRLFVQGAAEPPLLFKALSANNSPPLLPPAVAALESAPLSDLKPYAAMKDSGIQWLGEVPTHWTLKPGRACFREKAVPNTGLAETTVLSLSYGRIVVKPADRLHGLVPASFETYQIIEPGDIVIRPTDLQNDWNSLRFGISRDRGIITSAYICFRTAPDLTPEYGHLLLHTYDLMKVFYGLGSGLRQNLDWSDFKYLPCLVPPPSEQSAIVRFLDHADRRIRHYIRAKQRLIKLLDEQKLAIIYRAVTRGLDPNVRRKRSGVEWLGDVPQHWKVIRLKYVTSHIVDCLHATPAYSDVGEYPAIRTADISPGIVRLKSARRVNEDVYRKWIQRLEPASGDILYSREGERFGIAACVPKGARLCISQRMMVFRILRGHNPHFIMWLLNSPQVLAQANQDVMGATAPHVNVSTIRNFMFAVPSHSEQTAIVDYVDSATEGYVRAIDDAQREITLLKELRARLIADIVTGKLDVREAVARLPEEIEPLEPLDETDSDPTAKEDEALEAVPEETEA